MTQRITAIERAVGTFVLVAILLGVGGFVYKAQHERWFETPVTFHVETSEGFGIVEGTVVKVNGVAVGTVESVELTEKSRVLSRLVVPKGLSRNIHRTSRVAVNRPPVLGATTIEIKSDPVPPVRPEDREVQGYIFDRPEEPTDLFRTLGVTAGDISTLVDNLNTTLVKVQGAVDNVEVLTRGIIEGQGALGQLFKDRSLYDNLNAATGDARLFVEKLNGLMDELRLVASDTRAVVAKLDRGEGTAGRLLNDPGLYDHATEVLARAEKVIPKVESLMGELEGIAASINKGEGSIGKFIKDETVFNDTHRILTELRESIEDAREQAPVSTFIGAVFGAF
ncbi:MAG: MCE family protein [Planctomycetes bacterium]|nr:MCE family protein [Planctomycetota bacterium]